MDLATLWSELAAHWRVVAVALLVSWLTALFGTDSRFPLNVPDRLKAPLTILLGQVVEAVIAYMHHEPWKQAAVEGLGASCGALAAFALLVKFVGGGKVPAPLAWLAFFTPEAKARNSTRPGPLPPLPAFMLALSVAIAGGLLMAFLALSGCAAAARGATEDAAQKAYGAQLDRCVDEAKRQPGDSNAKIAFALECQKDVKRVWGIVEVFPRDAGAER